MSENLFYSKHSGTEINQAVDDVNKAKEDLKVLESRVSNIVAHNNDTEGNSELIDIRTGADGTVYESAGDAVRGEVSKLSNEIDDLQGRFETAEYTLEDGYVNYIKGIFVGKKTGLKRSGYVEVNEDDIVLISNYNRSPKVIDYRGYALYNTNKEFVRGVQYTNGDDILIVIPPNVSFIAVTTDNENSIKINHGGKVNALKKEQKENEKNLEQLEKRTYALEYSIPYETLFNNVVCIGDSFTRGYDVTYPSGQRNRDFGYPEAIKRMTRWNTENFGISGSTPTTWYAQYKNHDFSGFDCAIICFGRNDNIVSDDDKLNYQNIINMLKTANEHMTIFVLSLVKLKGNSPISTKDATTNNVIKQIADNNNLPYLDIWNNSLLTKDIYYSDGVHLTSMGYMVHGKNILEMIKKYVGEYESEFATLWFDNKLPAYIH